jgi:hypothetical protein
MQSKTIRLGRNGTLKAAWKHTGIIKKRSRCHSPPTWACASMTHSGQCCSASTRPMLPYRRLPACVSALAMTPEHRPAESTALLQLEVGLAHSCILGIYVLMHRHRLSNESCILQPKHERIGKPYAIQNASMANRHSSTQSPLHFTAASRRFTLYRNLSQNVFFH